MKLNDVLDKYKDEIYVFLFKIAKLTVGSLRKPCYNPPVSKLLNENIKKILWAEMKAKGEFDFSDFIKNTIYKNTHDYKLLRDESVWFLILLSLYFNNKKKSDELDTEISFLSTFILLLKYYTSLSIKHMSKFCDETKAIMALDKLSIKSLFSSKNQIAIRSAKTYLQSLKLNSKIINDISNSNFGLGMTYLSKTIVEKYYHRVDIKDYKLISKLIIIFRTRISQSFKAYAEQYYNMIDMKISDEDKSNNDIIQDIINQNTRRMVEISDTNFSLVSKMTDTPKSLVKDMYKLLFFDNPDYDLLNNSLNIILNSKSISLLNNKVTPFEWLQHVKTIISVRTQHSLRSMLIQFIESKESLRIIFTEKSTSFKHKMIQSLGLVIGLSVISTTRFSSVRNSINYAMII